MKKSPAREAAAMGRTGAGRLPGQTFHSECMEYFEHLRRAGREDYAFEDEYYFTMPAVSGYS
ncbi:MAG: hypothetical protein OXU85_03175 [Thaumarchaeota archaeon]|nr:hypothetical protein [Nitrososphaerota archaeon]RNJ73026.1 MAG: hypothetical protein EB833_03645 [Thaumarchaeota archaeon S13]RNJ73828.1 MAG: hypothetical protein EB832_01035 [Thaumarchaeota archaeon S14]